MSCMTRENDINLKQKTGFKLDVVKNQVQSIYGNPTVAFGTKHSVTVTAIMKKIKSRNEIIQG